jgi:hypothetical protein
MVAQPRQDAGAISCILWVHLVATDALFGARGVYAICSYWGQNGGKLAENLESPPPLADETQSVPRQ